MAQRLKCERQKGGREAAQKMTVLSTCFFEKVWPGGVSAWINQVALHHDF